MTKVSVSKMKMITVFVIWTENENAEHNQDNEGDSQRI
jgi:hypothetical protein